MKYLTIALVFACIFAASVSTTMAQTRDAQIPVPKSEKFADEDALAVPWRNTGCLAEHRSLASGCELPQGEKYDLAARLSLYERDGSRWLRFSISPRDVDHFPKLKNPEFVPFATDPGPFEGANLVVLRLVGVSDNWYKVEVNEMTSETKYISRQDWHWSKVSWEYWLGSQPRIYFDNNKTPVCDRPSGKPLDSAVGNLGVFFERKGDWIKIRIYKANIPTYGWLQWRDGRKILVGCVFNSFEVPEKSS